MKRVILLVVLGLLAAGSAFADQPSGLIKISPQVAKSIEGGIAVNPVTHKVYLIAESAADGADDAKAVFVFDDDALNGKSAPKMIPIAYENEYLVIDIVRNLIYVPTKFSVEGLESDDDGEGSGEVDTGVDPPEVPVPPGPVVKLGTLTVIDGNTDTVIAVYTFAEGIEPEGVAVDPVTGVVYVAAKAPEGEAAADDVCNPWATPIYDVGEPADVECWTSGFIYAFSVDAANKTIQVLKVIPAGDDPESLVFTDGKVYAANEDDGTVTIASAVNPDGTGGELLTDTPRPPTQPYELGVAPYTLGVFYDYGPNPLACVENKFEADKMAAGGGSAFITDDRSRVAKITGTAVVGMWDVPGATECLAIPNSDGGGANTANNIAFMERQSDNRQLLYVVSEQNTVAVFDPATMEQTGTITIPEARHLDGIGVDGATNRVWLTDEDLQLLFVLQGACADGTGVCSSLLPQDSTTNVLSLTPNPAGRGELVSFAATISTIGTHPPTGTVAFYDNGIGLGSERLTAAGVATYSNSLLFPGQHHITAVYGGDTYNAASTSAEVILTIDTLYGTSTSLSVTPNPAVAGAAVTFSGTVTTNGTHRPTGTITFSDGNAVLGTATLDDSAHAVFSMSNLAGGAYSIAATYSGDGYNRSGTSNVVTVIVDNPTPALTSISPASASASSGDFNLTVNGTGFVPGSVVQWNGSSRATNYVSPTQLLAAITSADVSNAGSVPVTVSNPTPGGGISGVQTFTISAVSAPVPVITGMSPGVINAGAQDFNLTVLGNNFANGATVTWNGSARPTTVVDGGLQVKITAADVASTGMAELAIVNPSSLGGGVSQSVKFVVDTPVSALGKFGVATQTVTVTVAPGQNAEVTVTFTGVAPDATLVASCVNLPLNASCSYSNGTVTITTGAQTPPGSYPVIVIFSATQQIAQRSFLLTTVLGFIPIPFGFIWLEGVSRRRRVQLAVFGLLLVLLLAGCGFHPGPQPQNATTTITQTSVGFTMLVR